MPNPPCECPRCGMSSPHSSKVSLSARSGNTSDIVRLLEACHQRMYAQEAVIRKLAQDLSGTCGLMLGKADKMDKTYELLLGKVIADSPSCLNPNCLRKDGFQGDAVGAVALSSIPPIPEKLYVDSSFMDGGSGSMPARENCNDQAKFVPPDSAAQIMQAEIQNSENVDNKLTKQGSDTSHQDAVLLYGRGATWITQQDTEGGLVAVDRRALFNANSICYRICETQLFHVSSLMMICINAIYIGVEADANDAKILSDAPIGFQVMEHVFCVFFVFELAVRYGAFVTTSACVKDRWFMFDFFLVVLMVIDTWIFGVVLSFLDDPPRTGAVGGIGRMFRLLRLTRISKLMHTIPELVTMAKGMVAAVRAVHAALLILVILVYVFAIIINAVIGEDQDLSEYLAENFSTVRDAMITLTLQGVLMDDINTLYRELISYGNILSIIVFGIFVLLSAITVMNMLIGVLCQVVLDVSEAETEDHVKAEMSKTLLVMLENLDDDGSGELSKKELQDVIAEPEAIKILNEIQVDTQHLLDIFEMLYTNEGTTLPIHVIMNIVLVLRGRRSVTMDDFAKGNNFILWALEAEMKKNTETVTTKLEETLAAIQDKKRT